MPSLCLCGGGQRVRTGSLLAKGIQEADQPGHRLHALPPVGTRCVPSRRPWRPLPALALSEPEERRKGPLDGRAEKGQILLHQIHLPETQLPASIFDRIRTWSWNARIIRTVSSSRDSRADATSKQAEANSTCRLQQPCCLSKTMLLPPAGSSGSA